MLTPINYTGAAMQAKQQTYHIKQTGPPISYYMGGIVRWGKREKNESEEGHQHVK